MGWHWGILAGSGGAAAGWLALMGDSSTTQSFGGIKIDSSDNIYLAGRDSVSSNDATITKLNNALAIQWQRKLGGTSNDQFAKVGLDSSGNVIAVGETTTTGTRDFLIAKYNSSGTIQWQRYYGNGSGVVDYGRKIAIDSSGNTIVVGDGTTSGIDAILVAKYSTTGGLSWNRNIRSSSSGSVTASGAVAVDGSDNVYVCGFSNLSGSTGAVLAKYNSSGTLQFIRRYNTGYDWAEAITVDSSGNIYIAGLTGNQYMIAKIDSGTNIVWQRKIAGGGITKAEAIAIDSSGNVYTSGYYYNGSTYPTLITKHNSSGVLQWQRTTTSVGDIQIKGDHMYLCGSLGNKGFAVKLPVDGSATNTYTIDGNSWTYGISTLTESAASMTNATTSVQNNTGGASTGTSTLTDSATTYTITTEDI